MDGCLSLVTTILKVEFIEQMYLKYKDDLQYFHLKLI